MKTILTLPTNEEITLLCITKGFHSILNFLNAVRSGAKSDNDPEAQTYRNMAPTYARQLAAMTATHVPDADAIIAAPSSRDDVDAYRTAISQLVPDLIDLSSGMSRDDSVKAGDNATSLQQVIEAYSYKPCGRESSLKSLVIVDESVGTGKTTATILHHLRASGLPADCKVTIAAALAN